MPNQMKATTALGNIGAAMRASKPATARRIPFRNVKGSSGRPSYRLGGLRNVGGDGQIGKVLWMQLSIQINEDY